MMRILSILVLVFILTSSVSASDWYDQVSEKVLNKQWDEALSIIDSLNLRAQEQNNYKNLARNNIKFIKRIDMHYARFLKLIDEGKEQEALEFYNYELNPSFKLLSESLPFNKAVVDDINNKNHRAHEAAEGLSSKIKAENQRKLAEMAQLRADREAAERIELETKRRQREEEIARQKEEEKNRVKFEAAVEKAEQSPEYVKLDLACQVCTAIEEKNTIERGLAVDAQYAKKYKVVNYGRRDNAVQIIKADDMTIREGKITYKRLFGKSFNTSTCKKINIETCSDDLLSLSKKLAEEIVAGTH